MKKIIITSLIIAASLTGFSQKIGIKVTPAQDFTIVPAHTNDADSIAVNNINDSGTTLSVTLQFYKQGTAKEQMPLLLFDKSNYIEDWTNAIVIARIKVLMNIL